LKTVIWYKSGMPGQEANLPRDRATLQAMARSLTQEND
jgi:hypothetical protein